jgi:cytochrome b6-f complex iron-sulfur subunit
MKTGERDSRRHALGVLGSLAGAGVLGSFSGCGSQAPEQLRVPLSELAVGERRELELAGAPIELRRGETGVEALSLLCSHMGCPLLRRERDYFCACHEGRFDLEGNVIAGPPARPLTRIPARVDGDQILVGP